MEGLVANDVKELKEHNYVGLTKLAMQWSDGVIQGSETIHPKVEEAFKSLSKPSLQYQAPDDYVSAYDNFYDEALLEDVVLAD